MKVNKKQRAGGYTFNQLDVMGGQMARVGYSECDTPSYYNEHKVYDVTRGGSKSRKTSKKTTRKSSRKTTRKTTRKSTKKSTKKSSRKSSRKTTRK